MKRKDNKERIEISTIKELIKDNITRKYERTPEEQEKLSKTNKRGRGEKIYQRRKARK